MKNCLTPYKWIEKGFAGLGLYDENYIENNLLNVLVDNKVFNDHLTDNIDEILQLIQSTIIPGLEEVQAERNFQSFRSN